MAPVKTVQAVGADHRARDAQAAKPRLAVRDDGPAGVIFDPKAIPTLATHPVGTGPYAFSSMVPQYSVTLTKNPSYWGTPASVDKIVFRYYTDPNALVNAELAGDIDIIDNVPEPEQMTQFSDPKKFQIVQGLTNGKVLLSMNNSRAPLNKLLVRRAINYAIDRKALDQDGLRGVRQADRHALLARRSVVPGSREHVSLRPGEGEEAARAGRVREGVLADDAAAAGQLRPAERRVHPVGAGTGRHQGQDPEHRLPALAQPRLHRRRTTT